MCARLLADMFAVKHHIYYLAEEEQKRMEAIWHIRRKAVSIYCMLLLCIALVQGMFNSLCNPADFCDGHEFDNYKDFAAFMEQEGALSEESSFSSIEEMDDLEDNTYGETHKETLQAEDGTILCEYTLNNMDVVEVSYGREEDNYLPITVYTHTDLYNGSWVKNWINLGFVFLYIIEIVVAAIVYFKKISAVKQGGK